MNEPVSVREVMNREYVGASESDTLHETAELLVREEERAAVVLRGTDPIGVVKQADILAHVVEGEALASSTVGDVMSDAVPSLSPDAGLPEARDQLVAWSTSWALVTEDGDLLGTLTEHDILAAARMEGDVTEATTPIEDQTQIATTGQAATTGGETAADDSFEEQGICSACGTFTRNLASFNGQLLCTDCRDV
ncbi:CBS domain-containing protein [Haloarcula marina]|uniref:CBS domain-containing protein n=1 Tax=Haloarcula marina TaxID=2961574 RepID=UPI0020B75285|nr:CBS domain-containing protein [Halomicroarcula marina]